MESGKNGEQIVNLQVELKQTNTQFIKLKALLSVSFLIQSLVSVLFKSLSHW